MIICTIVWQIFVVDTLYNCTDPGWLDFLDPGNWVHGQLETVRQVSARAMSEPDTIKVGWSVARLWRLWYLFIVVSLAISALVAWRPSQRVRLRPTTKGTVATL